VAKYHALSVALASKERASGRWAEMTREEQAYYSGWVDAEVSPKKRSYRLEQLVDMLDLLPEPCSFETWQREWRRKGRLGRMRAYAWMTVKGAIGNLG